MRVKCRMKGDAYFFMGNTVFLIVVLLLFIFIVQTYEQNVLKLNSFLNEVTMENLKLKAQIRSKEIMLETYKDLYNDSLRQLEERDEVIAQCIEEKNECLLSKRVDYYSRGIDKNIWSNGNYLSVYFDRDIVLFKNILCSGSMRPTFDCGNTLIAVSDFKEDEIGVGDMVAYKSEGEWNGEKYNYILHRIVGIEENNGKKYYITKGDNNLREDDEKITFDDIEFLVVGIIF